MKDFQLSIMNYFFLNIKSFPPAPYTSLHKPCDILVVLIVPYSFPMINEEIMNLFRFQQNPNTVHKSNISCYNKQYILSECPLTN